MTTAANIECAVCLEPFKEPKILLCGHTFCSECCENLKENDNDRNYVCPTCRQITDGAISLPTNYTAKSMVENNNNIAADGNAIESNKATSINRDSSRPPSCNDCHQEKEILELFLCLNENCGDGGGSDSIYCAACILRKHVSHKHIELQRKLNEQKSFLNEKVNEIDMQIRSIANQHSILAENSEKTVSTIRSEFRLFQICLESFMKNNNSTLQTVKLYQEELRSFLADDDKEINRLNQFGAIKCKLLALQSSLTTVDSSTGTVAENVIQSLFKVQEICQSSVATSIEEMFNFQNIDALAANFGNLLNLNNEESIANNNQINTTLLQNDVENRSVDDNGGRRTNQIRRVSFDTAPQVGEIRTTRGLLVSSETSHRRQLVANTTRRRRQTAEEARIRR